MLFATDVGDLVIPCIIGPNLLAHDVPLNIKRVGVEPVSGLGLSEDDVAFVG